MNCPCKDCKQKGCGIYHDQCEEYRQWSNKRAEENKKKNDRLEAEYTSHPNKMTAIRKRMRGR